MHHIISIGKKLQAWCVLFNILSSFVMHD
jgi:hypothetical protein